MQLPDVYGQRDSRWAGSQLGTLRGSTIGAVGCYCTSFAMVASAFGHPETPATLDQRFVAAGLFVDGNLLTDGALASVYPDCQHVQTISYVGVPADLAKLQELTDAGYLVICGVDFDGYPRNGVQWHFGVAYDGIAGWADPWFGDAGPMMAHHHDPATDIQKFVVYRGQVVNPVVTVTPPAQSAVESENDLAKAYFEQLGQAVNLSTSLMQLAMQSWRRGESRGPALSGEYAATAPDGSAVVRQDFTACVAEYKPSTGESFWVELVKELGLHH